MKKILLIFSIIAIITFILGVYLYNKPVGNLENIEAKYNITSEELLAVFEENETQANKKYIGKVILVKGIVNDISNSGKITINLATKNPMSDVSCNFDSKIKQLEKEINVGDEVTIKGECTGYLMGVVLEKCILN